jgi:hypothetical protein
MLKIRQRIRSEDDLLTRPRAHTCMSACLIHCARPVRWYKHESFILAAYALSHPRFTHSAAPTHPTPTHPYALRVHLSCCADTLIHSYVHASSILHALCRKFCMDLSQGRANSIVTAGRYYSFSPKTICPADAPHVTHGYNFLPKTVRAVDTESLPRRQHIATIFSWLQLSDHGLVFMLRVCAVWQEQSDTFETSF